MKKFVLFLCLVVTYLFGQNVSDIAFTSGYNKFDDLNYLRNSRFFYGIRGGVYRDDFGFQFGFEHTQGANCQGLNLDRLYINTLAISNNISGIKPYLLLSAGYEISNIHQHKPSQLFLGAGAGVRVSLTSRVNSFIETRVLRKLKSDDTDIITTVGLALNLDKSTNFNHPEILTQRVESQKLVKALDIKDRDISNSTILDSDIDKQLLIKDDSYIQENPQKEYYIQMVALAKTNPDIYVKKLNKRGIYNVEIKHVYNGHRDMSIVVVGPYIDRDEATNELKMLREISKGAFIKKFSSI